MLAGSLNAVAGGGSFISFPALLFTGVPAIPANATNNISLWMGLLASGGAYRKRLNFPRRVLVPLVIASLAGGLLGAFLLLRTPEHTFMRLLPWLMLAATLLFVFGGRLRREGAGLGLEASTGAIAGASLLQLSLAVYGGYFGGGMGIVILALLAALGLKDIHAMNALKTVLSAAINGLAGVAFIVAGAVRWHQAAVMIVGAVLGGYLGAHFAQKLPQSFVRRLVITVGTTMTIYFFLRAYSGGI